MNFKALFAAMVVTALPFSANALSLSLTDNVNGFGNISITDGVDDAADNTVNFVGPFGGFQLTIATGVVAEYPPIDKLFANLNANLLANDFALGSLTLEVSHVFDGPDFDAGYHLTQDLNTLTGFGDVETFYGNGLFDKAFSLNDITSDNSSNAADISGLGLNMDQYSITHVITVTSGGCPDCTLQGSADIIIDPVPVPAGILLMGTAIAGFGVMRRRKQRA